MAVVIAVAWTHVAISNALLNMAVKKKITIEQKYLEVGHTQIEGDAMHSLIEWRMRNRIINVPGDYVQIIESARNNSFDIKYLEQNFSKSSVIFQATKALALDDHQETLVTDIRALMYSPSGENSYKLQFEEP
ncbi:unnamed protein product [Parnassius apollo]|uniref:(apollo) hypothetical protein n=1 Tax=Parnassius apollo TaxID=110799 RepID=A0A8S3XIF2_PARAO|nr:unnamed protein product [Parnassius apollo]